MEPISIWTDTSRVVANVFSKWRRRRERQQLRSTLVGRPETAADQLAAQTGRTPGLSEVMLRLGSNTRRMFNVVGVRASSNREAVTLLAQIGRACAHCPDWERCKRWLEAGAKGKGYLEFCPNAARFAELKAGARRRQSAS